MTATCSFFIIFHDVFVGVSDRYDTGVKNMN